MLDEIQITNVRNILQESLTLGSKFNVFYGANGSGKTSVLESIYLVSTAKSFRTNLTNKIINQNNLSLTVFARIARLGDTLRVGVNKSLEANTIRLNGNEIKTLSELAELLPVLVIEQDSHKLLESGPQWRRKFLDWGLFHVKHDFNTLSLNYRKALKQRNALLSTGSSREEIRSWSVNLAELGERYSKERSDYIAHISPYFQEYVSLLLGITESSISYKTGWKKGESLLTCLGDQIDRDILYRTTNSGPHKGDISILLDGKEAKDLVSRGQQKLLVYALKLAQVSYLKNVTEKETLLLLDDLGSELDVHHSSNLLDLLSSSFGQVCITTANLDSIPLSNMLNVKLFHVKHGTIEVNNQLSNHND